MWDYVFSPHAMMVDAAAGVVLALLRLLRPSRRPSKLEIAAIALVAITINRRYAGGVSAGIMPPGYVGRMVQACMNDESRETCLCAVDALTARIGEPAVMKLAVRAEANLELPKEFVDALPDCRG